MSVLEIYVEDTYVAVSVFILFDNMVHDEKQGLQRSFFRVLQLGCGELSLNDLNLKSSSYSILQCRSEPRSTLVMPILLIPRSLA